MSFASTPEVVKLLMDAGADSEVTSMLGDAVDKLFECQDYEEARALLMSGTPLESSAWGPTRAHGLAGVQMDLKALKVFMECGGDIFTPSYNGGTILHTASWQGQYSEESDRPPAVTREMLEFLVTQGLDLDARDQNGNTALHEAVAGDWPSPIAVEILLKNGANPNIQNTRGETPLILVAGSCEECVASLLDAHADPSLRDHKGQSALDRAIACVETYGGKSMSSKITGALNRRILKKVFKSIGIDYENVMYKEVQKAAHCAHLISQALLDREYGTKG